MNLPSTTVRRLVIWARFSLFAGIAGTVLLVPAALVRDTLPWPVLPLMAYMAIHTLYQSVAVRGYLGARPWGRRALSVAAWLNIFQAIGLVAALLSMSLPTRRWDQLGFEALMVLFAIGWIWGWASLDRAIRKSGEKHPERG